MTSPGVIASLAEPYVETHSIRYVWIAVAVAVAVSEITGVFRRRKEATRRDRGSQIVIRLCVFPGVVLLVTSTKIAPALDIHPPLVSIIAGLIIFAAGEALRVWSRVTLGRYFTYSVMTSADQPVITNGPYRILRHPSYTGFLLIVIGIGAVWANWLALVGLAAFTFLGLRYRIYVEEKALLEELGDRYRAFAEGRKRMVPYVW